MYHCLTDSGGIQEEVLLFGRPILGMRDTTERPEGVKAGTLRLVGTDEEEIYNILKELHEKQEAYNSMAKACNLYEMVRLVRELLIHWKEKRILLGLQNNIYSIVWVIKMNESFQCYLINK